MRRQNHNQILKKSLSLAIVFATLLPITNGASLLQILNAKSTTTLQQNNAVASTYPANFTSEKIATQNTSEHVNSNSYEINSQRKSSKNSFTIPVVFKKLVAEAADNINTIAPPTTQNSITVSKELIILIVDSELTSNIGQYPGLSGLRPELPALTLSDRVSRYANDIVEAQPMTDVQIIEFNKETDTTASLSLALEKKFKDSDKNLSGIVLIGDIPLPVVNKNGNQFVSMLPFTDFEDKSYIYNNKTDTFDYNKNTLFPKAEIWHGVMRPSGDTPYAMNEFASYLDKNHLYHSGDPEFANFDKRLFFGDFINEEKNLNRDLYSQYLEYLDTLEDTAYFRYNKFWANALNGSSEIPTSQNVENAIETTDDSAEKREKYADNLANIDTSAFPDVLSKQIIDKQLLPYYKLASKYLSLASQFAKNTGRYSKEDVLTAVSIISMKDEYAKTYLKGVNDMLEAEINKLANEVQRPIPLLNSAKAKVIFKDAEANENNNFEAKIKFDYTDGTTRKSYINGILTRDINSAKQCSIFLGSTKESYFDENGDFNPKAVNGEYSTLTQNVRSNNFRSAMKTQTIGVNTHLLSPAEAFEKTNGAISYGAVITSTPAYGIPAFLPNPLTGGYKNVIATKLKEGDVISKINNIEINPMHDVDDAIMEMYNHISNFKGYINNADFANFKALVERHLFTFNRHELLPWENGEEDGNAKNILADFVIEFYRNGQKKSEIFTFTVNKDGYASKNEPTGTPEIVMSFSKREFDQQIYPGDWTQTSQGALFTLYDNGDGKGIGGNGYSIDSGCDVNNAGENSDRCFYTTALMPVLDPAGGVNLTKTTDGFYFKTNSTNPSSETLFKNHLQLPVNDDSFYKLDDIDEIYLDSCYNGLQYTSETPTATLNENNEIVIQEPAKYYTYNRLVDKMSNFLMTGDNGHKKEKSASADVWDEIKDMTAHDVILFADESDHGSNFVVRLDDFTKYYGVFDGIDNDGDGIADYEMRDFYDENGEEGQDGIKETKWYGEGFPEAAPEYALPSDNLPAIYRRMFSQNAIFTLPAELSPTNEEISLQINVQKNRDLSSVILHNEPTPHTLSTQARAMTANALPIDNPRYVTFLKGKDSLERINYPNTFKETSFAQLVSDLDDIATRISLLDNAYLIFGDNAHPGEYTPEEIKNEILTNRLMPLVNNEMDNPPSGFGLKNASTEKVYDAMKWLNLDIDQKHTYALEYYLNPEKDAFIEDSKLGFESAYLVFEGNESEISFGFNKIEATDESPLFNPIKIASSNADTENENNIPEDDNSKDDGYEYVSIKDFMKELNRFSTEFQNLTNGNGNAFESACGEDELDEDAVDENIVANSLEVARISIEPESTVLLANGESKTVVNVVMYTDDGRIASNAFENVSLFSNGIAKFDSFDDLDMIMSGTQIAINEGVGTVTLYSTTTVGKATVSAILMTPGLEDIVLKNDGKFKEVIFEDYLTDSISIDSINSADIVIKQTGEAIAGSNEPTQFDISLMNNDKTLLGYNGPISISTTDSKLGGFTSIPEKMKNGNIHASDLQFYPNKTAGISVISVDIPGFTSKTFNINIKPNTPAKIKLSSESDTVYIKNISFVDAVLLDKFDNVVSTDNSTSISFEVTDYSLPFAHIEETSTQVVKDGRARIKIKAGNESGIANVIANVLPFNNNDTSVATGTLSLKVKSNININTAKGIAPKALYITLLGSNFGGISNDENIAQALLYSGYVQAISTLSAVNSTFKALKISTDGTFSILDKNIEAKTILKSDNFPYERTSFFDVVNEVQLGEVFIIPNNEGDLKSQDVNIIYDTENILSLNPGVYFVKSPASAKYSYEKFFSGSSTRNGQGIYLVNDEMPIEPNQMIGFSYSSLDDIADTFGIGFTGENKSMLLFTAGNSVGESNKPYVSEAGIIYGDPTIHVKKDLPTSMLPFESTLGEPLYSGEESPSQILKADMNNDGHDDILAVYKSGDIILFENEISNKNFKNRGVIIKSYSPILSATTIDINNDGFSDIMIGTEEECHVGDDCLNLYTNINGISFEHESLRNMINGKAYEMNGKDMNIDGCDDLIVSDSSGTIRVFYNQIKQNKCVGLNKSSSFSKNFGPVMDSTVNQKNNLFIYYPGIQQPNTDEVSALLASHSFIDFGYENNAKYDSSDVETRQENAHIYYQSVLFNDGLRNNTKKTTVDLNGESLDVNDIIKVTLVLQNDFNSELKNVSVSDLFPATFTVNLDSLKCIDLNCNDTLSFTKNDIATRDFLISGISIPANGKRTISYTMTVNAMPKIGFEVGNNFTQYKKQNGEIVPEDMYPDIFVKKEINPNNTLTYLYSTGVNAQNEVKYDIMSYQNADIDDVEEITDGDDLWDIVSCEEGHCGNKTPGVPANVIEDVTRKAIGMYADNDFDGVSDSLNGVSAGGSKPTYTSVTSKIADGLSNAISASHCGGGGCSPIPYNYAFLVPGTNEGVPVGFPMFAFGASAPWFSMFAGHSFWPSQLRIYVSPTASLGLGAAICAGDPVTNLSPCFAFSVPSAINPAAAACEAAMDKIKNGINRAANAIGDKMPDAVKDAISTSDSSNSNPDVGMTTMISDGEADSVNDFSTGNFSSGADSDSPVAYSGSINVRVPGFPSVITDWIDRQTDEVYNKLLDLPDLYIYYPDPTSLAPDFQTAGENFKNVNNIHDVLSAINSIPLVEIETKEVELKVPMISKNELTKWKFQAEKWLEFEKSEYERVKNTWTCDDSSESRTICDAVLLDMSNLITSIEDFMKMVDAIIELPNQILNFRNAEAKYANQIICYLDTIMEYSGGYITRQKHVLEAWVAAIDKAIKTFRDWRLIFDLAVDYQESCDECKNDRFSQLGFLMNLFIVIPSPPIIEIPKWPDMVIDLSHVESGMKIVWPDVKFTPKNVILPNLPTVRLPDVMPQITYKLPSIDFSDIDLSFDFSMIELKDLPALKLPKLPDLPKPPKIYSLPKPVVNLVANLKPLFKILCLLKKGFVPIPEGNLKTEIETLTQPSVQAVFDLLPLAGELGITMPAIEYDFVEKIQIDVSVNASLSTDFIYQGVKYGADKINKHTDAFVNGLNKYTTFPLQGYINEFENKLEDKVNEKVDNAVNKVNEKTDDINNKIEDETAYNNVNTLIGGLQNFSEEITKYSKIAKEANKNVPTQYKLVANGSQILDARTNRTLEQVKADIASRGDKYHDLIASNQHLSDIQNLRDSFIAYSSELNTNSTKLSTLIADTNSHKKIRKVASRLSKRDTTATSSYPTVVKMHLLGKSFQHETRTLLASAQNPSKDTIESDQKARTQKPVLPKGFYLTIDGIIGNILSYTTEINKNMITKYIDYDSDNDIDIIYTLGGDIYMKNNDKNKTDHQNGAVLNRSESINDIINDLFITTENVSAETIYNEKFEISFMDNPDVLFYIIELKKNNKPKYKYLAVKTAVDSQKVIDIIKEYGAFTEVFEIENTENISITGIIDNSAYTATVTAFNADGLPGIATSTLVTASSCADKDNPYPSVKKDSFEIAISEVLVLDASSSFDLSGHVVEYWIESLPYESNEAFTHIPAEIWSDLNILVDTDGDHVKNNDKTNPIFKIGPFTKKGDLGKHNFILHVVDQSGNSSNKEFTVNVISPKITLMLQNSSEKFVFGDVLPQYKAFFKLFRKRNFYQTISGGLISFRKTEEIQTSSQINGHYRANEFGKYKINDLSFENMIIIIDPDGNIIAEVNPDNGNIGNLRNGYHIIVNSAELPDSPLNIQVLDDNDHVMATVFVVGGANNDVEIKENAILENKKHYSVTVNLLNNNFKFNSIGSDQLSYTGGATLYSNNEQKNIAYVDTIGNFVSLDERITLQLKNNNYKTDQVIISILFDQSIIGELLIPTVELVQIAGPNDVPSGSLTSIPTSENYSNGVFSDANGELNDMLYDLYKNGVIKGENGKNGLEIRPHEKITRSEFVEMLLRLLCITPRESAYKPYTKNEAQGGFSDLVYNNDMPESYAYIKEANLLGLVNGYLGETDDNGLHPFKPTDTITRAEATKIILHALEFRKVVSLSNLKEGSTWYSAYIDAGMELTPFIITDEYSANSFVITQNEASVPEETLTRAQLFTMASRVLEFYNCFATDLDNDGMSDFCEKRYDIDDPNADNDNDGLENIYECAYGLDPTNKDTDNGGINDGIEVDNFTDPLNPSDDSNAITFNDDSDYNEGAYVVPGECTTCPCASTITNNGDIVNDDILFTAIINSDRSFVFAKSNDVTVQFSK